MDTMIIMPVNTQPPKCPKCHNVENKKVVCRNCGYEYEEEEFPFILIGLMAIIIPYIIITMVFWLTDTPNVSLKDILVSQLDWIKSIRIW